MTTEFTWWERNPETGKFQVRASVHGGQVRWFRQEARFESWKSHEPTASDWDRLIEDASRRVPRRLISPAQFEELKRSRQQALAEGGARP